jgi:hypothetical protein
MTQRERVHVRNHEIVVENDPADLGLRFLGHLETNIGVSKLIKASKNGLEDYGRAYTHAR